MLSTSPCDSTLAQRRFNSGTTVHAHHKFKRDNFTWEIMATYQLEPTRETLCGRFSREHTPILTITSGDSIRYRTLDSGWGLEPLHSPSQKRRKFEPRGELDDGHCVIGPVAVQEAKAGSVLEIQIGAIRPGDYGFCVAGGWPHPVNERLGIVDAQYETVHSWTLDAERMVGHNQHGHTVALRPFMGVMGLAPDEPGMLPTPPPRFCGGNLDCKELVAGSSLFLPVAVDGGLFYVGDGHALQGDGEVSVTAIECPMQQVDLTFFVHDHLALSVPRAKTAEGWLTFGLHTDIEEAMYLALEGMVHLIEQMLQVGRTDALALASIAVDLRITQIVNGVRGVHAVLPHGAIR
jgi:acetamidase/formamidase